MFERYCGFILTNIWLAKIGLSIAWQDRISIAWQTRISIARHCLPKAGTSASWLQFILHICPPRNCYCFVNNVYHPGHVNHFPAVYPSFSADAGLLHRLLVDFICRGAFTSMILVELIWFCKSNNTRWRCVWMLNFGM